MRFLNFIVSKQSITCDPSCDFNNIASGTRGYLYARFRFSADWMGCSKVAIFSSRGKDHPILLLNNMCLIPWEALLGNTIRVSVVGQKGNQRITTNKVEFKQTTGGA